MKRKAILFFIGSVVLISYAYTADAYQFYKVVHVNKGDFLAMRQQPDTGSNEMARIPYNAEGIYSSGQIEKKGQSTWVAVIFGGQRGWVNNHYLGTANGVPFKEELSCVFTEPFYSIDTQAGILILKDMGNTATPFVITGVHPSANHTNAWVLNARSSKDGHAIMFIQKVKCSDDMSNLSYNYKIGFYYEEQNLTLTGCANQIRSEK